ncbi:MAG: efflux RND transporter periplasmic adaptor subunit [Phycisphaerae bacterium]|nr:efflux RND transporter periplasmic adaptor subunit [Phycisphaerae bacterium]
MNNLAPMPATRWRTRIALPLVIVALVAGILIRAAWSTLAPAKLVDGTPAVLLVVEAPAASEADDAAGGSTSSSSSSSSTTTVQAAGWIEPDPFAVYATAFTEGVIEEVLVLEGDTVERGQVVARLVTADAEIASERAEAEVRLRQAARDAAAEELETLIAATRAKNVSAARVDAAEANVRQVMAEAVGAGALLAELIDEYTRKEALLGGGAASTSDVKRLGFRIDAQRAAIDALHARQAALEAARNEARAELEAATMSRSLLVQERAALAEADAQLALAQAMRREAALRRERTEIKAPLRGVILARMAVPGMMVSTTRIDGAAVASLYDPDRLQVRADVPNADIALIGVGQSAEVRVEAMPDTLCRGTVTRISAHADIAKNTVQVKIRLHDPPPALRPDMLCRVKIHAGSAIPGDGAADAGGGSRQRLFIPAALVRDSKVIVAGTTVDDRGIAEERAIRLGRDERDGWIEVIEGVRPGDVLLDPALVHHGDRVHVNVRREGGTS